ncbi:MAG: HD domain-containing protein [Acidimicrobiales bacterium]
MELETHEVGWTRMEEGSAEDYRRLIALYDEHALGAVVDNILTILEKLRGPNLGYQVDRYEHSLQSATRAARANESDDLVVGALLHDIGDVFAPRNHSAAAASLLAPYVDEQTEWIVRHHGVFQGYYYFHHMGADRNARDAYRSSPYFDACAAFCAEYDQNCFDPKYDSLPIEEFEPLVRDVFGRPSRLQGVAPRLA